MSKDIITAEKIISAIEREEITKEINQAIIKADEFLYSKTEERPKFLDEFFEKTRNSLISTVNSCIKSRNNVKKKDDLKKYKEGYFNEIIQNANDVVGKSETINPKVIISLNKEDTIYTVKCSYPDDGFTLKDIYGFCTRGNSNKDSENGQEGMYGIGIKSLFCFCDYFCIENNIKIELKSESKPLDIISIKPKEKANRTVLTFKFTYIAQDNNMENKYAGFNVGKLANLIDDFYENKNIDDYFYSDDETKIVFDVRSLIFTDLRKNRIYNKSIKNIIVESDDTTNTREYFVEESMLTQKQNIKISTVSDSIKYFVFHYDDELDVENSISIAYPLYKTEEKDRIYATYFVSRSNPLLRKQMACLVNTKAINSSRSGLERENESEPQILNVIKEKGKQTITDLITILHSESSSEEFKRTASNLLCKLLYIYREEFIINNEDEMEAIGIFSGAENHLYELIKSGNLILSKDKRYIWRYKSSEEGFQDIGDELGITKNRPENSDDNDCINLIGTLLEVFIRNDCIISEDRISNDEYNNLSEDIKILCEY